MAVIPTFDLSLPPAIPPHLDTAAMRDAADQLRMAILVEGLVTVLGRMATHAFLRDLVVALQADPNAMVELLRIARDELGGLFEGSEAP